MNSCSTRDATSYLSFSSTLGFGLACVCTGPYAYCHKHHDDFVIIALYYNLRSVMVVSPAVFVLFRKVLAVLGILDFHVNLRLFFSIYVKNYVEILMGNS